MKEVTIKIEEEVYEYFERLGEVCEKSAEESIAEAVRGDYKWES